MLEALANDSGILLYNCFCDRCGSTVDVYADNETDAEDQLTDTGWLEVPAGKRSEYMVWLCPVCVDKCDRRPGTGHYTYGKKAKA